MALSCKEFNQCKVPNYEVRKALQTKWHFAQSGEAVEINAKLCRIQECANQMVGVVTTILLMAVQKNALNIQDSMVFHRFVVHILQASANIKRQQIECVQQHATLPLNFATTVAHCIFGMSASYVSQDAHSRVAESDTHLHTTPIFFFFFFFVRQLVYRRI